MNDLRSTLEALQTDMLAMTVATTRVSRACSLALNSLDNYEADEAHEHMQQLVKFLGDFSDVFDRLQNTATDLLGGEA